MTSTPHVGIVLLNWNSWANTLRCAESLLRQNYGLFTLVILDNASTDESVRHITDWAAGHEKAPVEGPPEVQARLAPVEKPVRFRHLTTSELEANAPSSTSAKVFLLETGANLGCARAYNLALGWLLRAGSMQFVWVLNHDTVVDADALRHLVSRALEPSAVGESTLPVGIVGSTACFYETPDIVQRACGDEFNFWLAKGAPVCEGVPLARLPSREVVERRVSYVAGPSMLVSRAFLETVGLMTDSYFLYFEEVSWAVRARGKYRFAFAPESIVFHRDGGSTKGEAAGFAEFLLLRNRLVFTRLFAPWRLPTVYLGLLWELLLALAQRQHRRARLFRSMSMWSSTSLTPERMGPFKQRIAGVIQ